MAKEEEQRDHIRRDRYRQELDDCFRRAEQLLIDLEYLTDKYVEYSGAVRRKNFHKRLLLAEGSVLALREWFRHKYVRFLKKKYKDEDISWLDVEVDSSLKSVFDKN